VYILGTQQFSYISRKTDSLLTIINPKYFMLLTVHIHLPKKITLIQVFKTSECISGIFCLPNRKVIRNQISNDKKITNGVAGKCLERNESHLLFKA
jgi:uncharacterized membrane protein YcgQ (UPF0703/DUF1980 family)